MIEIVLLMICLVPTMLGLAEIIHWLKLLILSPKKKVPSYVVLYLTESSPREQISFAAEKYSYYGDRNIIAVNTFVREEDFEECKAIADKNDIIFCSANELLENLKPQTDCGI